MKILIVDDEYDLNNVLSKRFKLLGNAVKQAYNGQEALDILENDIYDVVLLDVMMPKLNGFEVLKRMRQADINTPVLFMTAKDSDASVIEGLNLGADDYIIKPFSFDVLYARVNAISRRLDKVKGNIITIKDLTINQENREIKRNGELINLSNKEYELLIYFVKNKNTIISREGLENALYGYDTFNDSNVIDVHVRHLRNKIDSDSSDKLIQTVRGVGYMLKE